MTSDDHYLPEDYIGAIQFALAGAASDADAIALIRALVLDYPTDPKAMRPTRLFCETAQALDATYRVPA